MLCFWVNLQQPCHLKWCQYEKNNIDFSIVHECNLLKDASLSDTENYRQHNFSYRNTERSFHKVNAKTIAFIPCYNSKNYHALIKRAKIISNFHEVNAGFLFSVYCSNYGWERNNLLLLSMPLEAKLYNTSSAKTFT